MMQLIVGHTTKLKCTYFFQNFVLNRYPTKYGTGFDNADVNGGGTETIIVVVMFKVNSVLRNKRHQT